LGCTSVVLYPFGRLFGLAIVNEIVDAHGWEIRVTDADGGGACFKITGIYVK
jgi:K+-sensing histidine kinase KdpD